MFWKCEIRWNVQEAGKGSRLPSEFEGGFLRERSKQLSKGKMKRKTMTRDAYWKGLKSWKALDVAMEKVGVAVFG